LDTFVVRATSQNDAFHVAQNEAMKSLSSRIQRSIIATTDELANSTNKRMDSLSTSVTSLTSSLTEATTALDNATIPPLSELREEISATGLKEYEPTGATPLKQNYLYPTSLPRTQSASTASSTTSPQKQSQGHKMVYIDTPYDSPVDKMDLTTSSSERTGSFGSIVQTVPLLPPGPTSLSITTSGLRELDPNLVVPLTDHKMDSNGKGEGFVREIPSLKRSYSGRIGSAKKRDYGSARGFSASVGSATGRRLRSSPPQ
jgi:kinesin family protein 11